MSKKYLLALSSCPNLQKVCYTHPSSPLPYQRSFSYTSSNLDRQNSRAKRHKPTNAQAHESSSPADNLFPWPEMPASSTIPTPYQIFQLQKTAPYSKGRFYELVKLYHPDRHGHCCNVPDIDGLSHDVKMKRYRLVVAANNILSDPSRRRAYDLWGAGWSTHSDVGDTLDSNMRPRWSGFQHNGSPANNATWEDWEKWYRRGTPDHRGPVYCSNGEFISFVALVVMLSAIWQASRVDGHQKRFNEQVELIHNDASKNIHERRNQTRELSNDKAILRFVRAREQSGIPTISGIPGSEDFNKQDYIPP